MSVREAYIRETAVRHVRKAINAVQVARNLLPEDAPAQKELSQIYELLLGAEDTAAGNR